MILNLFLILFGKIISKLSSVLRLGSGATWPGHITLNLNPKFIREILNKSKTKIIVVAGTNGKTTTTKLIRTILEADGKKIFQNSTGANLLNGLASTLVENSSLIGKLNFDYGIFEIDENTLPLALKEFVPDYLVLLNLFRDQLDRYGEVNTIALKWQKAIQQLNSKTLMILNADDPQIAFLGKGKKNSKYFGLDEKKKSPAEEQILAADSTQCQNCGSRLKYQNRTFSHLGNWYCASCKNKRPTLNLSKIDKYPLPGTYNKYNALAAVLTAQVLNIPGRIVSSALQNFSPAFGRQEKIEYKDRSIQLFLSKNPTSFNESLRTMAELGGKHVLFVLNDRIPDGRDVSWIWDTALEGNIDQFKQITVSGDRTYDMAIRLKYASKSLIINPSSLIIEENLSRAINLALDQLPKSEILYVLPTYSAMLEVREILTGKKIL